MRNTHEPLNHKIRAAQLRKSAEASHNAGYECLAQVDWEMANYLDPPRKEEESEEAP